MARTDGDLPRRRNDPVRDLLDLIGEHAKDSTRPHVLRMYFGQVQVTNDPNDGIVVDLDNTTTNATDCVSLDHVVLTVGDRVLVLHQGDTFCIVGVLS